MGKASVPTTFVFHAPRDTGVDYLRKVRAPRAVGGEVTRSSKEKYRQESKHRFLYFSQESGKKIEENHDLLVHNTLDYEVG